MYYIYRKGLTDGRNRYRSQNGQNGQYGNRTRSGAQASTAGGSDPRPRASTGSAPAGQGGGRFRSQGPRRGSGRPMSRQERPSGGRFGRGGGNRGRGKFAQNIDISKFVNKAIITESAEVFVPEHAFADFNVAPALKANIAAKGYVTPTPIQDKAIPHVLRGADVVGIANTGTGKTAAFLIPLINKVLLNRQENVLIVVPTRELAIQIDDEFRGFAKGLNMHSACLVGGAPMGKQISDLRRNPNFIMGTPGRIKDHIERRFLHLGRFNTVVLDEADRMLDMGFINDMKFLMSLMPEMRHTLFFSATMSRDIEVLIKDFLKDPVSISVKTGDTSKNVDQDIVRVGGKDKVDVLHELLSSPEFSKVLVFGRTKHGVEKLSRLLAKRGIKADSIHGNKSHGQRQRALGSFKDSRVQVLIATDVAARGLDISEVSHVINYDIPETYEDYVHRIGRTGRAGSKGKALTFVE